MDDTAFPGSLANDTVPCTVSANKLYPASAETGTSTTTLSNPSYPASGVYVPFEEKVTEDRLAEVPASMFSIASIISAGVKVCDRPALLLIASAIPVSVPPWMIYSLKSSPPRHFVL